MTKKKMKEYVLNKNTKELVEIKKESNELPLFEQIFEKLEISEEYKSTIKDLEESDDWLKKIVEKFEQSDLPFLLFLEDGTYLITVKDEKNPRIERINELDRNKLDSKMINFEFLR